MMFNFHEITLELAPSIFYLPDRHQADTSPIPSRTVFLFRWLDLHLCIQFLFSFYNLQHEFIKIEFYLLRHLSNQILPGFRTSNLDVSEIRSFHVSSPTSRLV